MSKNLSYGRAVVSNRYVAWQRFGESFEVAH